MSDSGPFRTGNGAPEDRPPVGSPIERRHASDQIFRELASAILNRELTPDAPLPPERELADRFGVSRIVVREAIHRLKEYELVRVRQGSPTIVLDPDRATDMRILGLEIELVAPSTDGPDPFLERQVYAGAGLIDLAEQRMSADEIDEIEHLVDDFLAQAHPDPTSVAFERAFWTAIARGSKNRVYLRETIWYFNVLERDLRFRGRVLGNAAGRALLYRSLLNTLRQRSGTAALFLTAVRSVAARVV